MAILCYNLIFSRFEQQAQERLDRARAVTSLNEVPQDEANWLIYIRVVVALL